MLRSQHRPNVDRMVAEITAHLRRLCEGTTLDAGARLEVLFRPISGPTDSEVS
jgi:hypothetical protein